MAKKKKAPKKTGKKAAKSARQPPRKAARKTSRKPARKTAAKRAPQKARKAAPKKAARRAPVQVAAQKKKDYTITIRSVATGLDYTIDPPTNAKKPKVKHGDTVRWQSPDGEWTINFANGTPLEDGNGNPVTTRTSGPNTPPLGGVVSEKTKACEVFKYDVVLEVGGERKSEDPEIIIDEYPKSG